MAEKYTPEQMRKQFDRVCNKDDWKREINARVKLRSFEVEVLYEAIIFFTGSVPMIVKTKKFGEYLVRADGYYIAVGA